ncbi:hypothetical protein D3C78_537080 [compost metagenome]
MGNAEGLVQVHVRNIGADIRRPRQPDLGVEVGAIHVHLTAMLVDHFTDFADAFLVHAMGRRIGRHQAGEFVGGLRGFFLEVIQVDVARLVTLDDHHAHPGHLRRRGIGAVRRRRNQADIAAALLPALMVFADRQQPGVFALGTGVGLHADGIETGDRAQPAFQFLDHQPVPGGLLFRHERVQVGELRPGDRDHLAGGVELHGAGAQRDHRLIERQVLVFQLLEVAQHLGFAVMGAEYRMAQIRRSSHQPLGNSARQDFGIQVLDTEPVIGPQKHVEQPLHGGFVAGLVEAQAQLAAPENAQVDLRGPGTFDDRSLGSADFQRQGVEEVPVDPGDTLALKPGGQDAGQPVNPLGDPLEPFGAVVDRIETGDIGQQHLGRADVGVGLLPANVLLAGLQGHAQGGVASRIFGNTDDAPGNRPFVLIAAGKKCRVRPTVAHRHTKPLGRAEHHIGAQFTRRGQQQQAQ